MTDGERALWLALIRTVPMAERVAWLATQRAGFPPMCDAVLWRAFWEEWVSASQQESRSTL